MSVLRFLVGLFRLTCLPCWRQRVGYSAYCRKHTDEILNRDCAEGE